MKLMRLMKKKSNPSHSEFDICSIGELIDRFGIESIHIATGASKTAPYNWKTENKIPAKFYFAILNLCVLEGVFISPTLFNFSKIDLVENCIKEKLYQFSLIIRSAANGESCD
jgi:hypothetical protein